MKQSNPDKIKEPIIHKIYMKLFSLFSQITTSNADKIVHISKFARDEYYGQRGFIRIQNKYYDRKKLIKAGFFIDNGILRHKGELQ